MVYTANYEPSSKTIQCQDQAHLSEEECPHNICQCDRQFIYRLLDNYKQCILGVSFPPAWWHKSFLRAVLTAIFRMIANVTKTLGDIPKVSIEKLVSLKSILLSMTNVVVYTQIELLTTEQGLNAALMIALDNLVRAKCITCSGVC